MSKHTPMGARLNILVVDDEAGSRAALAVVLQLAGHQALFAKDGDEALELFDSATDPFDLIITDHLMVRVSGLDLVRKLREKGFAGEIVVMTAYAGTMEEQEYRKMEVAGILEKPFDLAELRQWLDCIDTCRKQSAPGEKQPSPPPAIDFFWFKRD